MHKSIVTSIAIMSMLSAVSSSAQNGNAVLKKAEDTLNAPKDRVATMTMQLIDKSGNTKNRVVKMYQKGHEKRLIRFLEPADVRGVGFLVLSDEEMWLFMPAFHKIRRIASHAKNEDFMGTDFTYDDMAQSDYTDKYTATIAKEGDDSYTLELKPTPNAKVNYSKLVMVVNKKTWLPDRVEFYDKAGRLKKVMTNASVEKVDGYWTPKEIAMEDIQQSHRTIMKLQDVKHDTGLKDDIFSKRYLRRGA